MPPATQTTKRLDHLEREVRELRESVEILTRLVADLLPPSSPVTGIAITFGPPH
jgi:hypothetical protein